MIVGGHVNLEPFDPGARYVTRKRFTWGKRQLEPGDRFSVRGRERRSRQMYDALMIQRAPDGRKKS